MIYTETIVYKVTNEEERERAICECAVIVKGGGIVAFPTETVYGLGGNGLDVAVVERIYEAKMRPPVKPLSLCVGSLVAAEEIAVFNDLARTLFNAFLPGPLTLVLPKKACVPDIVTAGLDSVGVRVPAHPIALGLSRVCQVPIALPSANLSGMPSLTDGKAVTEALWGRVDAVIDGGVTDVGVESTILSLVKEPKVLRQGALPFEELAKYL